MVSESTRTSIIGSGQDRGRPYTPEGPAALLVAGWRKGHAPSKIDALAVRQPCQKVDPLLTFLIPSLTSDTG